MDVHDSQTRSYNMSQIKGKDTRPELIVRRHLFKSGFRYRIHVNKLPGKPDIVLSKYKTVIFVNGCFWHKHEGCKNFVLPKTRTKWWFEKINKNVRRDKKNIKKLEQLGWKIFVVWECELKADKKQQTFNNLYEKLACQN